MQPNDHLIKFLSTKPLDVWLDIDKMVNDPAKFIQLAKDCIDIGSLNANFNDDFNMIKVFAVTG